MQRLFTTFPNSAPGLALLILRLMVGVPLVVSAVYSAGAADSPPEWLTVGARLVSGLCLCAGIWAPLVATAVAGVELWAVYSAGSFEEGRLLRAGIALCLVLLGPGAWSVDARLFGRKRLKFDGENDDLN